MSNFVPHEVIAINDKDLPQINNQIKTLIKTKNEFFKDYLKTKTNVSTN